MADDKTYYEDEGLPSAPPSYDRVPRLRNNPKSAKASTESPALSDMQQKIYEVAEMMSEDKAWRGKIRARSLIAALGHCIDLASVEFNQHRQDILNAKAIWNKLDSETPPECNVTQLSANVQRQIMALMAQGNHHIEDNWQCATCCAPTLPACCTPCSCASNCCTTVTDATQYPHAIYYSAY